MPIRRLQPLVAARRRAVERRLQSPLARRSAATMSVEIAIGELYNTAARRNYPLYYARCPRALLA